MEAKHTPGPWSWYWRLGDHLEADCGVTAQEGSMTRSICRAPRYEGQQQWAANANLIAAAPELLSALQAFIKAARLSRLTDGNRSVECELAEQIVAAEDAIAKATGSAM